MPLTFTQNACYYSIVFKWQQRRFIVWIPPNDMAFFNKSNKKWHKTHWNDLNTFRTREKKVGQTFAKRTNNLIHPINEQEKKNTTNNDDKWTLDNGIFSLKSIELNISDTANKIHRIGVLQWLLSEYECVYKQNITKSKEKQWQRKRNQGNFSDIPIQATIHSSLSSCTALSFPFSGSMCVYAERGNWN